MQRTCHWLEQREGHWGKVQVVQGLVSFCFPAKSLAQLPHTCTFENWARACARATSPRRHTMLITPGGDMIPFRWTGEPFDRHCHFWVLKLTPPASAAVSIRTPTAAFARLRSRGCQGVRAWWRLRTRTVGWSWSTVGLSFPELFPA